MNIFEECQPCCICLDERLFFYSNENSEPIPIHAQKGDMECKFWILPDEVDIKEAFGYQLTPAGRREIRKIIFQHFDLIVSSWYSYFRKETS